MFTPPANSPVEGADRAALVEGLRAHGHRSAHGVDGPEGLEAFVREHAKPGDMVVCLGAGSITEWTGALPSRLGS